MELIDMKRLAIACLALACALFWLAAGAPVFGGSNLLGSGLLGKLTGGGSEAHPGQDAEAASSAATPGAPAYSLGGGATVEEVLFANEAIQAITAGREVGRGLSIWVSPMSDTRRGVTHMVSISLRPPASYEGEVPTMSDPCEGHYDLDGRIDPDHPCHNEPRDYGTKQVSWHGLQLLHVAIDTDRGQIVRFRASPFPLGDAGFMSEQETMAEQALSTNEVLQAMTAGREIGNGLEMVPSSLGTARKGDFKVELYFTPPLSYEGQVPTIRNDPCTLARKANETVYAGHPCMDQPRVVETKDVSWRDIDGVYVTIDSETGEVVSIKELRLPW